MPLTAPATLTSTRTAKTPLFATDGLFAPVAAADVVIVNDGTLAILANNTDSVSHTVTVDIGKTVEGHTAAAKSYTLLAGELVVLGPYPAEIYNQRSGANAGKLVFHVSHATVKVQLLRLG